MRQSFNFLILFLFLTKCFATDIEKFLSLYEYERGYFPYEINLIKETPTLYEYSLKFPSSFGSGCVNNDTVHASYFEPKIKNKKFPAVVILHSWKARRAGKEKEIAKELAKNGIAGLVLVLPFHMQRSCKGRKFISEDLEKTIESVREAVIDIRRGCDWLEKRENIDSSRIGIIGISLGAIIANLSMGIDERFKVDVSILGGGNLAKILWKSPIIFGIKYKMVKRGWNLSKLEDRLKVIDPITYVGRIRERKVLMINGLFDFVIPKSCVEELWNALGKPSIIWLPTDHFTAVLLKGRIKRKAIEFFEGNL